MAQTVAKVVTAPINAATSIVENTVGKLPIVGGVVTSAAEIVKTVSNVGPSAIAGTLTHGLPGFNDSIKETGGAVGKAFGSLDVAKVAQIGGVIASGGLSGLVPGGSSLLSGLGGLNPSQLLESVGGSHGGGGGGGIAPVIPPAATVNIAAPAQQSSNNTSTLLIMAAGVALVASRR